jgi:hypothetical protein
MMMRALIRVGIILPYIILPTSPPLLEGKAAFATKTSRESRRDFSIR